MDVVIRLLLAIPLAMWLGGIVVFVFSLITGITNLVVLGVAKAIRSVLGLSGSSSRVRAIGAAVIDLTKGLIGLCLTLAIGWLAFVTFALERGPDLLGVFSTIAAALALFIWAPTLFLLGLFTGEEREAAYIQDEGAGRGGGRWSVRWVLVCAILAFVGVGGFWVGRYTHDRGSAGQIKTAHQQANEAQLQIDAKYQQDHNLRAWKAAKVANDNTTAGQILQITGGKPVPSKGDKVMDGYYALFRDPAYTTNGRVTNATALSNALDAYQARLSAADQTRLAQNTGRSQTTPTVQAYREAVKRIDASGYWKLGDAAAQRVTKGQYQNYRDLQAATDPRGQAILKQVNTVLAAQKVAFLRKDPQVDALVSQWFGRKPSSKAAADLLFAATGQRVAVAVR